MNENEVSKRKCTSQMRSTYLPDYEKPSKPETPPWSHLPFTVVVGVFHCLKDNDKIAMSQVCKTWRLCFLDPSLWRKRVFYFIKTKRPPVSHTEFLRQHLFGAKPAVKFAKCFSRCLQDVEIKLHSFGKVIFKDWSVFVKLLDVAKLRSLKVRFYFSSSDRKNVNVDFLEPLLSLPRNHPSLEEFRIGLSRLDQDTGFKVLQFVANNSADTLKTLLLDSIYPQNDQRHLITEIKKFTKLCHIKIESVILTEDLLNFWTSECPSLSYIKILFTPKGSAPSDKAWQSLVATHPDLLVKIKDFEFENPLYDLAILSPAIPLVELKLIGIPIFSTHVEVISFLNHVTNYQKTLKRINITFIANFKDLDGAAVMNIFSQCSKLRPHKLVNFGESYLGGPIYGISENS